MQRVYFVPFLNKSFNYSTYTFPGKKNGGCRVLGKGGNGELWFNRYRVLHNGNSLWMDGDNANTTLCVYVMSQNCACNNGSDSKFHMYFTTT